MHGIDSNCFETSRKNLFNLCRSVQTLAKGQQKGWKHDEKFENIDCHYKNIEQDIHFQICTMH